jgi:drug/metabolite transporter (DMT)-like permease
LNHSSEDPPANEKQDHVVKGIGALIAATLLFALQDAITKNLTATVPVAQLVVIRFFFFALFALVYASRKQSLRRAFVSQWPRVQILRGLLITAEIGLFAFGLHYMGIAELHSIFACFPLIITALSVPLLAEQVGWRRWIAVIIGFIGTLIIVQPGSAAFSPYALIPIVCALLYAIYNLLTRKVSRQDSFETSLLYFGVVGFISSMLIAPFFWQALDTNEILWLLMISIISIFSHLFLIKSLELAPAVILQPFNYFILVWASIIGYSFYDEILPMTTIIGGLIVVGSGIYIGRREYIQAKQLRRQPRKTMYPADV